MTVQLTRRDLLKRASGLLAVAAVGGLTSSETEAAAEHQGRNRVLARSPAFAPLDLSLRQAVNNGTVAGVVAMGATQRGQHQLGGTAEQLFLGRSGQEGGRHAVHADPAVLRPTCGGSVRTVRAGAVHGLHHA